MCIDRARSRTKPRRQLALGVVAALMLLPTGAASQHVSALERLEASPRQAVERAFGFEVGEERRYLLGPPEAIDPGESASWAIRLERVRDNGEAVFVLDHVRSGPTPRTDARAIGEEISAQMHAELVVNRHGFPTLLALDVRRSTYGYADDSFYVRYVFDGRSMLKHVNTFGKQWDIALPVSGHRNLDRSVPTGLYVFLPDAFHCVGSRASVARVEHIDPPLPTAGSPVSPGAQMPRVQRYARVCEPDTDLGFLNPGLLSLAWPALIEADGSEDFLFFTPTGADLFPGPRVSGNVASIGGTGGGGGGIDRARDVRRYYSYSRIEFAGRTAINVMGRSFDAIAVRIRGLGGTAYFDESGKALLIEIDRTGFIEDAAAGLIRRGTVGVDPNELERRHIRLMFPSEY